MSKHVAVLMGGWSAEREVSLRSGKACAEALERQGYRVTRIDVGRDVAAVLAGTKPDVALNVLHGSPGEDGTMQGLLEIMAIPYSHSGVHGFGRRDAEGRRQGACCRAAGVPVPEGLVASRFEAAKSAPAAAALCHQADRGGIERRCIYRYRCPRPSAAGTLPRGLGLRGAGHRRKVHRRQGVDLRGHG